jgi:5-methylcytosine-specific restriction endonuclease McrA
MACDHPVTTVHHRRDGRFDARHEPAPSKRQRRLLRARHRQCQFPGCHHAAEFDAHHVIPRSCGGATKLWNLVRLCRFHHRVVHLHRLVLILHPDRRLEARWPDGTLIDRDLPPREWEVRLPGRPDDITGAWLGERLRLDDCFAGLGIG